MSNNNPLGLIGSSSFMNTEYLNKSVDLSKTESKIIKHAVPVSNIVDKSINAVDAIDDFDAYLNKMTDEFGINPSSIKFSKPVLAPVRTASIAPIVSNVSNSNNISGLFNTQKRTSISSNSTRSAKSGSESNSRSSSSSNSSRSRSSSKASSHRGRDRDRDRDREYKDN